MTTVNDTFNRADGALGTEPGGLPWSVLAGAVTIASHQARATTNKTESGRSIAVLPLAGDGVFTATLPAAAAGGECLYFRVSDANNWWRLRVTATQTSYQYVANYTCTESFYASDGSGTPPTSQFTSATDQSGSTTQNLPSYWQCTESDYHYNGSGYVLDSQSSFESSYDQSNGAGTTSDGGAHVQKIACYYVQPTETTTISCTPNYATATSTTFAIYLDKCVNGTVTSTALNTLTATNTLTVTCSGEAITVGDGTHTQGTLDAFNQTATSAGVGTGPTSQGNSPVAFASMAASFSPTGDSAGPMLIG